MKEKARRICIAVLVGAVICTIGISCTSGISAEDKDKPKPRAKKVDSELFVHDENEKLPPVIAAGKTDDQPPADAVVLFDGTDVSAWSNTKGEATKWIINDTGDLECVKKAGYIQTRKEFGSCQLHVEWRTPKDVKGNSQGRGNSGVFLMGKYEVQVLDSYDNVTYADGQASAIYGQKKPLANVSRGPDEWQSYDIVFHRPIFKGKTNQVVRPATITVFHNGVLVQDHWEIKGITWYMKQSAYRYHADKLPIKLQDHGNPIRYRNIWVREIPEIITK